jgi:BirA family biotin operon repressor/biotin-[acetyl-CoA-carboxylase] ligase
LTDLTPIATLVSSRPNVSQDQAEQSNEEMILAFLADGGDEFTSGEALSDKLGLSRTAVWKYVESLRKAGYRIEAVAARGYRLIEVPDRLTALELSPLLNTRELGRVLHYQETISSTNEVAYRLASEGASHGEVVICEQQTAGRGRRGRTWVSPPGLNLYFSVILRPELPPQRAPELTLVTAVAVAETLREAGADTEIKWPNDLQVDGLKVGGILTELSAEPDRVHFAVVGVGLNLNATEEDFPPELREVATSVREVCRHPVSRSLLTAALWARLEQWLDRHAEEGFAPVREAWRSYSCTLGEEVLVKAERRELRGVAEDIDETGALLVRTPEGVLEKILAGDVEQLRRKK